MTAFESAVHSLGFLLCTLEDLFGVADVASRIQQISVAPLDPQHGTAAAAGLRSQGSARCVRRLVLRSGALETVN